MANHGSATIVTANITSADGNDYAAHEAAYRGFLRFVRWGTAAVVAVVALMAIFLV
jgi:hypothetical protein